MLFKKMIGVLAIAAWSLLALSPAPAVQSSYELPETGPMSMGTFVDTHLNPALRSLATCHSGATAPTNGTSGAAEAGQCWIDTTTTTWSFKYYDGTDWIETGKLVTASNVWRPTIAGTNITSMTGSGSTLVKDTGATIGTATLTSPVISGGTINNAIIGATTPLAGSFTALDATSATISGLTATRGVCTTTGGLLTTTCTSAGIAASVTNETGTGSLVFGTSPALVTPDIGVASATSVTASGTVTGGDLVSLGNTQTSAAGLNYWLGRTRASSPADGSVLWTNNAATDFGRLMLGGTTSSFPAIKRSGSGITLRVADDTADTDLTISAATISGLTATRGVCTTTGGLLTTACTSAGLAASISNETGTGVVVFNTSPALVTPDIGTPSAATLTNATGLPISTGVSGLGTGVATALGTNVGSAGSPVVNGGVLGTPSSGTLTNATGLPIATGVSGLGTGCATWLATPSSANLRGCLTDEVGTGAFYTVGGALGTPASGTATNLTGLPLAGVTGFGTNVSTWLATPSSANLAASLTDETGSGAAVFGTGPTISAAILTGLVDFQGAVKYSTQSAPAQITANQNDYNPSSVVCTSSTTLLINSNAARDITGLAGGTAGCLMRLTNNGSFTITLKEQNAGSSAGNRFNMGGDFAIAANSTITVYYDSVASRWRNTSATSAGAGSGTVTSVVCGAGLSGGTISTSGTCDVRGYSVKTITYLTSGTAATYTVPADVRALFVEVQAGGGGGGATDAAAVSTNAAAGGASGGACARSFLTGLSATYTYTVGTGGAGAVAGTTSGTALTGSVGGNSSFGTLVAPGGAGGLPDTASGTAHVGGQGGTNNLAGGSGTELWRGGAGGNGVSLGGVQGSSGMGGHGACTASGSTSGRVSGGDGNPSPVGSGGGGGGGMSTNATARAGGAGAAGIIKITEYY